MTLLRRLRHENVIAVLDIMAPPAAQVANLSRAGPLPDCTCQLFRHARPGNGVMGTRQAVGTLSGTGSNRPTYACQAGKFADIYLVYELMDTDLHQIIRSPQPLSDEHVQYFIYQVRTSTN